MRISDWSSDVCASDLVTSERGLLTTIACGAGGAPTYALEGSVFSAGALVQWLRDGLKILKKARSEERSVGKVCVSRCRSRWSPDNKKKRHQKYDIKVTLHKSLSHNTTET